MQVTPYPHGRWSQGVREGSESTLTRSFDNAVDCIVICMCVQSPRIKYCGHGDKMRGRRLGYQRRRSELLITPLPYPKPL